MNTWKFKFREQLNSSDEVVTVTHPNLIDDIKWLFEKVASTKNYRAENYKKENSEKEYAVCYTISYWKGIPALASCAWNRPFYEGMTRVATRYCVNPDFIHINFGKGTDGLRLDTIDHIDQQVEFTLELGYRNHFMSREDRMMKSNRMSALLTKDINKHSKHYWKCTKTRRLVAPNPNSTTCWQYVIYRNEEWLKHENN